MNIKITEPILKTDFNQACKLVEENLFKNGITIDELKKSSSGELLIAKSGNNVVGMLHMRRPGKIFKELKDKYFYLKGIKYTKESIGYIALVSVDKSYQKQGIGKKLMKSAIKIQNEWGSKAIIVHASQSSPGNASEKLFSSFGFTPVFLHKKPWREYSRQKKAEGFECIFCGNPCHCDELEMILYL